MYQFLTRLHTYCQYHVYFCCFHSDFIYYCSRGIHQQVITNSESVTSPNRLRNHCLNQYRTTAPCTSIGRCESIASVRLYSELIQMYTYIQRDGKGLALLKVENPISIKWKPFRVTGLLCGEFTGHRWIPCKGQWRGVLMLSLICAWINGLVNNRDAGDLWRHRAHYDVIVMNRPLVPEPDGKPVRRRQHRAGSGSVPAIGDTVLNIPVTGLKHRHTL